MNQNIAQPKVKRLGELKTQRSKHESHWKECFEHTVPEQNPFTNDHKKDRVKLFDSTGSDAVRLLVSSIMSGTTPANSRWFDLTTGQQDEDQQNVDEGERWLSDAGDFIWRNIHNANYDAEGFVAALNTVIAGWCVFYIDIDRENGGFVFENWSLADCYLSSTKRSGEIDVIYREYELSAQQCVTEFGDDVSDRVKEKAEKQPDEKIKLLHVIEPRQGKHGQIDKSLPFASYHIEVSKKHLVRESGYHEFPCAASRWDLLKESHYGIGEVSKALPEIKGLNELKRLMLRNADIAVNGQYIAEDDGVLNPSTVKFGAGQVIIANSVDSMKPLQSASDFRLSEHLIQNSQREIRKLLMADQLQPADGPAMTATEVHVRVEIIRQQLGPIYGRRQSEFLTAMIYRCFGLALREGVLGQPPESLQGQKLQVKYQSPLARAQRLEEVSAIERFMNGVASIAGLNPEVLDIIDTDAAVSIHGQNLGVPHRAIRSKEDTEALRQQRAEAQQAKQQQMQQAQLQQKAGEAMIDTAAQQAAGAAA